MGNVLEITDALSITVSSMTIVFLTLVTIALILGSFKYIFKQDNKYEAKKEVVVDKEQSETINDDDEEDRLIACLAASAMAGDGKLNPNLHIKRVIRIK